MKRFIVMHRDLVPAGAKASFWDSLGDAKLEAADYEARRVAFHPDRPEQYSRYGWAVVDTATLPPEKVITVSPVADGKITQAETKVPFSYIPLKALKGCARVFGYGRRKYAPGNFLLATLADGAADRYVSAGARHLADCQNLDGTWNKESLARLDAESGLPELDHLITGLIMLRAVLVKEGVLPEDPGAGKDPVK